MAPLQTSFDTESRVLAQGAGFALIAAFVPGLANTVLVQLLGNGSTNASFSLYLVYRESSTTFEVTSKLEIAPSTLPVEKILRLFVKGAEFETAVLAPLVLVVRDHLADLSAASKPA